MSPLSELAPGRGLPRVAAPNVEGASVVVCGEVRVAELGEGVELVRFGSDDHARAERIYSLSVAGLFGIRAAGVDAEGPWLVREPGAPTLEDRPEVDPLELATSLAGALAACERSALFPGPLRPRDVSRFEGRISLRADALYRALAGMPADPSARDGASRWERVRFVVVPHLGSYTRNQAEMAAEVLIANVSRYLEGKPLLNRVDFRLGY